MLTKEERLEITRQWRKRNKNHISIYDKKWQEENKARKLFINLMAMYRRKGVTGNCTFQEWEALKKKYKNCCACCGQPEGKVLITIDHIIPIKKGGTNYISNLQPLCRKCNEHKHIEIQKY